tara:strand:+ start:708 stop:1982 length:1275 start_codon:yes stop_codon:yes gene_type:complete
MSSIYTSLYPFRSTVLDTELYNLNSDCPNYISKLCDIGYNAYATIPESLTVSKIPQLFKNGCDIFEYTETTFNGLGQKIIDNIISKKFKEPWIHYIHLYDLYVATSFTIDENQSTKILNDKKFGKNKYERVLSAMDPWIGKIIQNINFENTILVLSGDHGTDIGEYNETMEKWQKENIDLRTSWEPGLPFKITKKVFQDSRLNSLKNKLKNKYVKRRTSVVKDRINSQYEKIESMDLNNYEKRIMKNAVFTKSQTYDSRFRVPLLFVGNKINKNQVISKQVRSIDIFPTLEELLQLDLGITETHGRSLLPFLKGNILEEEPVLMESAINSTKSESDNTIAVRTSQYKYFRDRDDPTKNVSLFDLKKDPLEEENIAENNVEIVHNMENTLNKLQSDKGFNIKKTSDLSDTDIKEAEDLLSKLGYI